jgi:hypothetical protein
MLSSSALSALRAIEGATPALVLSMVKMLLPVQFEHDTMR